MTNAITTATPAAKPVAKQAAGLRTTAQTPGVKPARDAVQLSKPSKPSQAQVIAPPKSTTSPLVTSLKLTGVAAFGGAGAAVVWFGTILGGFVGPSLTGGLLAGGIAVGLALGA